MALTCPIVMAQGEEIKPLPGQCPPLPPLLPSGIPAFPGAWGGGMFSTGGRGGQVIEVSNLNDSGPGSLRAAIDAAGARIVIFRVGGVIPLKSDLNIDNPDITIAGQTAPGDGICIVDYTLNINTRNVIIRHCRVRLTVNRTVKGHYQAWQFQDCIGGNPEGDIVIDHCTTSWGTDESLSLYRFMETRPDLPKTANGGMHRIKKPVRNLTVQWCLISESLRPATHGATWGGRDATFHHNLFASNGGRNSSIGMSGEFDYRNNVIFNWAHRTIDGGDETSLVNLINNYLKPGPATSEKTHSMIARLEERDMYSPGRRWGAGDWYPTAGKRPGKWYIAGNVVEGHGDVTMDNWKGVHGNEELARVNAPFEGWPVRQETAHEAYISVLEKSGATLPRRDAIDRRVVESVRTGKTTTTSGILHDPSEVGGLIEYAYVENEVLSDSDHDGMPDTWEEQYGFNKELIDDGRTDKDNDGYTNVEEYLNGTDPTEAIDYTNLGNNVDTIS